MMIRNIAVLCALGMASLTSAATVRYVGDGAATIVPSQTALTYTQQIFGTDPKAMLEVVDRGIRDPDSHFAGIVKLHVAARTLEAAGTAREAIRTHYPADKRPAVAFVVGELTQADSTLAIDAIFAGEKAPPPISFMFIAGQAQKGATPAQATANTLAALVKTLEFLKSPLSNVLHARCFLANMSAASEVKAEFDKVFGDIPLPIAFVEWKSAADLPAEIEMVVVASAPKGDAPAVEYLTPPGMTASPLFARVTRVNRGDLIFIGGLHGAAAGSGEQQVLSIFGQLDKLLLANGSDLRHLVKATYYVSDDDASKQLNALRPKFYDPQRPPAASKAMVPGVGAPDRSITIDMIAVTP